MIRLAAVALALAPLAHSQLPVKIDVKPLIANVGLGERARISITLLDAGHKPAPAPRDWVIPLYARLPSGEVQELGEAVLQAGQATAEVRLPPATAEGFLYIWARHPELRLGGEFLRVRRPMEKPQVRAREPMPPAVKTPAPTEPRILRIPVPEMPTIARPEVKIPPKPLPTPPKVVAPRTPAVQPRHVLALRYSPQRAFLANGKDPATVHAFVLPLEGSALPGFRINLFDSSGTMLPRPLVIPPGEEIGSAVLTSSHAGEIRVEYLSATPPLDVEGDKVLNIVFEPPITRLEVLGSPPRVSLLESADVLVRLLDEEGTPTATDRPRNITLALESGRGEIETADLTIEAGSADGRTALRPAWWGGFTISASTPNLMSATGMVHVDPPLAILSISLLGGIIGGFLFFFKHGRMEKWRIPLGALTGIVLYWACLYLGIAAIPQAVVLNPLSAFVISVLGGWLGTEVFEPLLKRLGIARS